MIRIAILAAVLAIVLTAATTANAQSDPLPEYFNLAWVDGETYVSPVKLQDGAPAGPTLQWPQLKVR